MSRLYSVEWLDDKWIIVWKFCGKKASGNNVGIILAFLEGGGKSRKFRKVRRCSDEDATHAPPNVDMDVTHLHAPHW